MRGRCSECGDLKRLNRNGVCRQRHNCEHRQFQHRERTKRLLEQMDRAERHAGSDQLEGLLLRWFRGY